jgi:hypothetical protein
MDNVMCNVSFEIRLTPLTTYCVLRLVLTIFVHVGIFVIYTPPDLKTEI